MPVYEYECEKCGHDFEREQRMADPPVKSCPSCRSRRVRKLISRSSFVLKGSGWYADGYSSASKSDSAGEAASGETGSGKDDAAAAAKSEVKADAKPDAKVDAAPASESKPAAESKSQSKSSAGGRKSGKKQSAA